MICNAVPFKPNTFNIMWKYSVICLFLGLISCSGTKTDSSQPGETDTAATKETAINIQGQWKIENVVENDSSYVRPSEIGEGVSAYIDFRKDDTFGVTTNCNHIGGEYRQTNDSIRLTDISTTEMACDNMELEEMLKKVLPAVNSIDCLNDSITRLNTEKAGSYIVLRKSARPVK